jgi:hypothetical protein
MIMAGERSSSSSVPGVVTLVEGTAMRSAASRARLVFLTTTAIAAVLGAIALTPWLGPAWGFVIGGGVGFVLGLLAGMVTAIWPVLRVLWHWAAEITLCLLLVSASTWLSAETVPWLPAVVLGASTTMVLAVRPLRRWVRAWVWCAIVRHRLRLSFAAFLRSRNRIHIRGAQPLILLARPTPAGERVWVWLRPGLDLAELETNTSKLAVACWASSVRVACTSPNRAALVRIDVSRRDPLVELVDSPLVGLMPAASGWLEPADGSGPTGGLDLDDVPEPAPPVSVPRPRTSTRRTTAVEVDDAVEGR